MRIDELHKKSMISTLKDIVLEYDSTIDRFTLNIIGQALWQAGYTISKRKEETPPARIITTNQIKYWSENNICPRQINKGNRDCSICGDKGECSFEHRTDHLEEKR